MAVGWSQMSPVLILHFRTEAKKPDTVTLCKLFRDHGRTRFRRPCYHRSAGMNRDRIRRFPAIPQGNPMRSFRVIALSAIASAGLWAGGGFGAGVQTAFAINEASAVVPRLDFLHSTDSTSVAGPITPINLSTTANIFSLGADYDYFITGGIGKGFYVLAGLGVAMAGIDVSGSTTGAAASTTSHQTVIYPEAGAGYQFNRTFGLELLFKNYRFSDVTLQVGGVPAGYSYSGGLQVAVTARF